VPFRPEFDKILLIWSAGAAAVFVMVTGLLLFAIARNRASRRTELPFRASKNNPLEGAYAVALVGAIAALAVGSWVANSHLSNGEGTPASRVLAPVADIAVTAQRWCWSFGYSSAGVHVDSECIRDRVPTVVVPVGRTVDFALRSVDVVHAFWLPDFAAKRDVYPDHVNHLRITFPHAGVWAGRCSEFCGPFHHTMRFLVRALPPEQYQSFLDSGGTLT
jgi:cytochrome c oxidase subunit 2